MAIRPSKIKLKRPISPSRMVKSNGKYSPGKLAILVFSFVAIAVIVAQLAFASSWGVIYYWNTPGIYHQTGNVVSVWFGSGMAAVWESPKSGSTAGYMWYGPYSDIYVPQPSGMWYTVCADVMASGPSIAYMNLEFSINHGQVLAKQNFDANVSQPTRNCMKVKLRQGVYGGVEYRVSYGGGSILYVRDVFIYKND